MSRQYFTFNGETGKAHSLFLTGPGVYDSPAPDVEEVTIPGLNGSLLRNNSGNGRRRYNNVEIRYNGLLYSGLADKTRELKAWLLSPATYCRLTDTYDSDFFRMATCVSNLEFDVTQNKWAEVEIVFLAKPQRWSVDGQTAVLVSSGGTLTNPYYFYAKPLIKVTGSGSGTLTVNGTTITINSFPSAGYMYIDCETQQAHDLTDYCNDLILAEDFPVLAPGSNTVTYSGGVSAVEITPRWWTL